MFQIGQSECVSLRCAEAVEAAASARTRCCTCGGSTATAVATTGRPGDNLYQLTFVAERPQKLLIEFDEQVLVVLTEPKVTADPRVHVRLDFEQMTLDWQGYGDLTPHASIWSKGYLVLAGQ